MSPLKKSGKPTFFPTTLKGKISRRSMILALSFVVIAILSQLFRGLNFLFPRLKVPHRFVRPPGAASEASFLKACIRCRACANVCEAGCINFFTLYDGGDLAGSPYLNTRLKSCNLCMNCTQICPTGALEPIAKDLKEISERVHMGVAKVVESNCLSFNGRICGICHDACPVKAISLRTRAQPEILEDKCIGCGRCEERCPQTPSAIIVYPSTKVEKEVSDA